MQLKRKKPNFIPLALLAGAALCIYGFAQYMNYREGQPVERAEPTKYWNCILEKLPGTQSDVIAYQSVNMCFSQFGGVRTLDLETRLAACSLSHVPESASNGSESRREATWQRN